MDEGPLPLSEKALGIYTQGTFEAIDSVLDPNESRCSFFRTAVAAEIRRRQVARARLPPPPFTVDNKR